MKWSHSYASRGCLFGWTKVQSCSLLLSITCMHMKGYTQALIPHTIDVIHGLQVLWSLSQTLLFARRESHCRPSLHAYWLVSWSCCFINELATLPSWSWMMFCGSLAPDISFFLFLLFFSVQNGMRCLFCSSCLWAHRWYHSISPWAFWRHFGCFHACFLHHQMSHFRWLLYNG